MEGDDAVFNLYRRPAFQDEALTVTVDVTESGDVINMAPSTVDFAAGSTTARLVVTTVDDNIVEPDSVVTATVVPGAGPYEVLGAASTASVTVTSEDTGDGPDPGEPDPDLPSAPRSFEATPGDHASGALLDRRRRTMAAVPSPATRSASTYGEWGPADSVAPRNPVTDRHTVTGLANGQAYTFEVRAVNAAGGGAAAAAITATPQGPQTEAVVMANAAEATEGDDLVFTIDTAHATKPTSCRNGRSGCRSP